MFYMFLFFAVLAAVSAVFTFSLLFSFKLFLFFVAVLCIILVISLKKDPVLFLRVLFCDLIIASITVLTVAAWNVYSGLFFNNI